MALSQTDRISLSKAFVAAPTEIAQIQQNKAQIDVAKVDYIAKDAVNKGLVDKVTAVIDPYQNEIALINGVVRTTLTEQVQLDAADRKIGNFLFPNEQAVPLPSVPDGIWKFFSPFFQSYGIGKQKLEDYGAATPHELQLIADINAQIAILEAATLIQRTTGQECNASGTCDLPSYTTQGTCLANGGVWTPGPDVITTFPEIHAALNELISLVGQWQTNLDTHLSALTAVLAADADAGRQAAATQEQTDINTFKAAATTWLALPDFNTAHGQTTCTAFNGYNALLLAPTKAYTDDLNTLKAAIATRTAQATARAAAAAGYLGSVVQDLATGDITGGSGFYLDRAKAVNLRLHAMGGSLSQLKGAERGINALDQFKKNKEDALDVYSSVLRVSKLRAPGNGTNKIHVIDAAGFTVGSRIYLVTDTQPELELFVQAVSGTMLTVDKKVPQNYRENEAGRVYKVL